MMLCQEFWNLTLVEIEAGRSSQATLLGRKEMTVESLYLSPALADEMEGGPVIHRRSQDEQMQLMEKPVSYGKTKIPKRVP
jgi:DNA adenine methylase